MASVRDVFRIDAPSPMRVATAYAEHAWYRAPPRSGPRQSCALKLRPTSRRVNPKIADRLRHYVSRVRTIKRRTASVDGETVTLPGSTRSAEPPAPPEPASSAPADAASPPVRRTTLPAQPER